MVTSLMKNVVLSVCLLGAAACGGKKGTIELDIVRSPLDDPFTGASSVRFTIGPTVKTAPVINGHFSFSLTEGPPKAPAAIVVEALDSMGNVVAHGQTPTLQLNAVNQGPYAIWVGRPGTVSAARAELPSPRTEVAALGAAGLGVLFAGGRDATGAALASSAVYDVFTQDIIVVKDLSTPRAGAAAIPSSPRGIVFGGATSVGLGNPAGALDSGELFDPSTGSGLWVAVPADSSPDARSQANVLVLGSGSGLVSGGLSEAGTPLSSALLVAAGGSARFSPLSKPMFAARYRHAGAAAHFPEGDGALLIGGVADGDTSSPVVERLIGQSFDNTFDATGIENRWDATATAISGGVLLVGGTTPAPGGRVATSSVVYIPTDTKGPVIRYDALNLSPRAGHTATVVGNDLLLCGGYDATNKLIASCDLLTINPVIAFKKTIVLGKARKGHVAVALETGPVLIAGGVDDQDRPLASIEIYTP